MFLFGHLFACCVFRNFYVVVVPLKRKSGTIKNLINPDEMDMEEVRYVKRKHAKHVPDILQARGYLQRNVRVTYDKITLTVCRGGH